MKDRYYVKRVQEISPIEMNIKYLVMDSIPENTFKHCKDPNANMILECDLEITAQKICELLNIEEYIREVSQEA